MLSENAEADNAAASDDELGKKIAQLQAENRKTQNEFNMQRAKLKELFMQKESEYAKCLKEKEILQCELDELKSQFVVASLKSENEMRLKEVKAQEEISSLQQMVQDTIEESTNFRAELERLKREISRLAKENSALRETESSSLAPQVLSHVKKTLVRTLGSSVTVDDATTDRDGNKQVVYEDAEVLHSIVVQLQDETTVLKEKLREADDKLQATAMTANCSEKIIPVESVAGEHDEQVSADPIIACDQCSDWEAQLQHCRNERTQDADKCAALEKSIVELNENLAKEAALRRVLEDEWQEKREAHKNAVQSLREQVAKAENELVDLQQVFVETNEEMQRQIHRVIDDRESVNKHLETLQADNDFLSGCYLATAEEIESQDIDLPNTVVELQELILRQQGDLIQARVATEHEKRKGVTSLDEIEILKEQLKTNNNDRRTLKKRLQTDIKSLQDQLREYEQKQQASEAAKATLERKEAELNRRVSELRVENIELHEANEKLSRTQSDCKNRIMILQDELSTSEQVQKDFVKLSQELQMALERLRGADTEVRWQDDDDVDACPSCKTYFTVTVRKTHCRHCGHIYCDKCLSQTALSGPRKRKARVCNICHTLLSPNTAPYFSHEPPAASGHV